MAGLTMPEDNYNLGEERRYWDKEALTFDREADHGLRDPAVRSAWRDLLLNALPPAPAAVLDMGCGTGSLSILLAEAGYTVTGLDFSPAMVVQAKYKAGDAGLEIAFQLGDAADPAIINERFDAIVDRHLLWALPDPALALQRWAGLLRPQGRMLLIEGYWHTGAGLHASQVTAALPPSISSVTIKDLSAAAELWGYQVNDERYLVTARLGS